MYKLEHIIDFKERLDDFWVYPKLSKKQNCRSYGDDYFAFLNNENLSSAKNNLYIHIPFCDSGCAFCPYYKKHGNDIQIREYIDGVIEELSLYSRYAYYKKITIDSVHFGGGNPLLLPVEQIERVISSIKKLFDVAVEDNWTMEGSINSIKSIEQINHLKSLGIERMSFGIQTFNPIIRKEMKIKATLEDIERGVDLLNQADYKKYCFDLMYNMPDQTIQDVLDDLEKVDSLNPYHIDIYNMAVFPNTNLDKLIRKGTHFKINPSNKNQIEQYRVILKWLEEYGYRQLITNTFSKFQDNVHIGDLLYLSNNNVLGVGVSSRGYIEGFSYKNTCDIQEYLKQVHQGNLPAELAYKSSDDEHADRKMIFFPILMKIKKNDIPDLDRYISRINHIIELGLAYWEDDCLRLTKKGVFWSGNISALFISEKNWNNYMKLFFNSIKEKTNPYNEDFMGIEGNEEC